MTEEKKFSPLLVWTDIETTGIKEEDVILEVAVIVTDNNLEEIDSVDFLVYDVEPNRLISHDVKKTYGSDIHCWSNHFETGLIDSLMASRKDIGSSRDSSQVEVDICSMLDRLSIVEDAEVKPPLCGSSVHFDRAFLKKSMPSFIRRVSYRNIDVSSIKECCQRFEPRIDIPDWEAPHRALGDLRGSIRLLKHFRNQGVFSI